MSRGNSCSQINTQQSSGFPSADLFVCWRKISWKSRHHYLSPYVSKRNDQIHPNDSHLANIIVQPELKNSHLAAATPADCQPGGASAWTFCCRLWLTDLHFVSVLTRCLQKKRSSSFVVLLTRWKHQCKCNLCTFIAAVTGHQCPSVRIGSLNMRTALMRCCLQILSAAVVCQEIVPLHVLSAQ